MGVVRAPEIFQGTHRVVIFVIAQLSYLMPVPDVIGTAAIKVQFRRICVTCMFFLLKAIACLFCGFFLYFWCIFSCLFWDASTGARDCLEDSSPK